MPTFGAPSTRFLVLRPLAQETWNYVTIALRASSPETLADSMRRIIAEMDPDLPLQQFGTVQQIIARFTTTTSMMSTILVVFAALGLFLAAIGLYGVVARLVVQRTPEIGLRLAVGAQSGDVVWLILRSGVRLSLLGSAFGLLGSFGISKLLAVAAPAMAQGLPLTATFTLLLLLTGLLLTVALLACWLPARRATKVDPMVALRAE